MKKFLWRLLITILILGGIGLIAYPKISDKLYRSKAAKVMIDYSDEVEKKDKEERDRLFQEAVDFNTNRSKGVIEADDLGHVPGYEEVLNITGTGIMGYLDIDKIDVQLPIYHGTDNSVLQIGAGHVEFTSLPVGGPSTHSVISGHTGLPDAELFTDLTELEIGDEFTITVLGKVLLYRVDQIKTVLPEELDDIKIIEGKDYCTLVTCTPYGINSHRLLVRGERVIQEDNNEVVEVPIPKIKNVIDIKPYLRGAIVTLLVMIVILSVYDKTKKKEG